jgi:membrane-bound ClpP family serine protease|tara:strand:+ start:50 stop:238 length:189 start_codon:yes stop_codon:yes gene_type:complete
MSLFKKIWDNLNGESNIEKIFSLVFLLGIFAGLIVSGYWVYAVVMGIIYIILKLYWRYNKSD